MEKLEHAECLGHNSITLDYLKRETIFFSGTSERIMPNQVPNTRVLSAMEDLTVFDTVDGGQMILDNEDNIFILVP
jgi:peroxiredoxin family protein